jgi:hypothetical protein
MVAFLARDEGAVACEHDVDRSVELDSLRGAVLLARRSITGDGGDVTRRADGTDAVVVSTRDVDGSISGDAEPDRIVEAGLERLAVREAAPPVARQRRDRPIRVDAPDGMIVLVRHVSAPRAIRSESSFAATAMPSINVLMPATSVRPNLSSFRSMS